MHRNIHENPKAVREAYLDEVAARVRGRMSALEAHETIEEMRAHIDATAAAYEEIGLDSKMAMSAALEKFGAAEHIGKVFAANPPRSLPLALASAVIKLLAIEAGLGALLMILSDVLVLSTGYVSSIDVNVDMSVGGTFGLIVGGVAWLVRLRPGQLAAIVAISLNLFLAFTFYPTLISLNRAGLVIDSVLILTPCVAVLAWTGARIARKASAKLAVDFSPPASIA